MIYTLARPLLFLLPPETAHDLALKSLQLTAPRNPAPIAAEGPVELMGLQFANRLGLAAGLDKNGDCIDGLGGLGFGFVELGTVTPRPQPGNAKPRLFRLPEAQAIINRMGFNNQGVDYLVDRVKTCRYTGVVGINIGKNLTTPVELATSDYLTCLEAAYPAADYITVNISSPNTPGLRSLQKAEMLEAMLLPLLERRDELHKTHQRMVPLVVKIAPDLELPEIEMMADVFNRSGVEGVIATNTTMARNAVKGLKHAEEQGGLSGKPLLNQSTEVTKHFRNQLDSRIALIAAGGVFSRDDYQKKLDAGADLVQVYTGLIYEGPSLVKKILRAE